MHSASGEYQCIPFGVRTIVYDRLTMHCMNHINCAYANFGPFEVKEKNNGSWLQWLMLFHRISFPLSTTKKRSLPNIWGNLL